MRAEKNSGSNFISLLSLLFLVNGWLTCFTYLQSWKYYTVLWQFISSLFHCPYSTKAFLRSSLNCGAIWAQYFLFHLSHVYFTIHSLVLPCSWLLHMKAVTIFCLTLLQAKVPQFIHFSWKVLCISISSPCSALVLAILPSSVQYNTLAEVLVLLKKIETVTVSSSLYSPHTPMACFS